MNWSHDIRYGFRMIFKHRLVSLAVILTLGLCLGASGSLFTVVKGLLISPFPYPEHAQLGWMQQAFPRQDINRARFSLAEIEDVGRFDRLFSAVAATRTMSVNLLGGKDPERVRALEYSPGFFELLDGQPQLGRLPNEEESRGLGQPVAVMSHRLWQRLYGGDRSVLGQTVDVNGEAHAVIGIMPARFLYGGADLWFPIDREAYNAERTDRPYVPLVRVRSGLAMDETGPDLIALAKQMENDHGAEFPEYVGLTYTVASVAEYVLGRVRPALILLQVAVIMVFLIACANVANLLLVRATARQKEIAVRTAMGSSRWRVVRQLLTESVILAFLGGGLGFLLTLTGVKMLVAWIPSRFVPIEAEIAVDGQVLLFVLVAALVSGLLFGLAPASFALRKEPFKPLKEGGRRSTGGALGQRLRQGLVVAEVALALIVLVGAGLMIRSLDRLAAVDPGFETENVLSARIALPTDEFAEDADAIAFYDRLKREVEALPGVESASTLSRRPLRRIDVQGLAIEGRPPEDDGYESNAIYKVAGLDLFSTLNIPLVRGRYLDERDYAPDAEGAVVINQAMVERFWSDGSDPIGARFKLGNAASEEPWLTIVGIVGDVKQFGIDEGTRQEFYLPYPLRPNRDMALMVRTSVEPETLVGSVRRVVQEIRPEQPIYDVLTMSQRAEESVGIYRLTMVILLIFASVALVLALLGIYATLAYSVDQRQQELGVRLALGAHRGDILRLVVGEGLRLALGGLLIGVGGALASRKLIASLVYDVSANDPWTIVAVALLLAGMAVLATCLPAYRASRTAPVEALRYE